MQPDAFIEEVYRRMTLRLGPHGDYISAEDFPRRGTEYTPNEVAFYSQILPAEKDGAIADIGSGNGQFIALCYRLGYRNITAIDWRAADKFAAVCKAYPAIRAVNLRGNIGDHFGLGYDTYDAIHMSHVIEHIPKYELLYAMDAIFKATRIGGKLIVRTPNMEGPAALSSLFVTLTHEYGFTGSNLKSILHICGFDDIALHPQPQPHGAKRWIGWLLRQPLLCSQRIKSRLFGVNEGGQFDGELIATARRGDFQPLFDQRYR